MRRRLLVALALLAGGCQDQSMTRQPRYGWQAAAPVLPGGAAALSPPAGVVAQGSETSAQPPTVDVALLQRGRERYDIFCAPCHGLSGDGDGVIVKRGFPAPASFHERPLRQASAARLHDAIVRGYGVMYPYATRVPERDRWAIVAYIRALQKSRVMTLAEAPEAAAKLSGASP